VVGKNMMLDKGMLTITWVAASNGKKKKHNNEVRINPLLVFIVFDRSLQE